VKSSTRPQYQRRKRILELIREGTRAGSLPNYGHFMRELAVSRRTVIRDRVEAEKGALAASITGRTSVFSGRAVWIRVPFGLAAAYAAPERNQAQKIVLRPLCEGERPVAISVTAASAARQPAKFSSSSLLGRRS